MDRHRGRRAFSNFGHPWGPTSGRRPTVPETSERCNALFFSQRICVPTSPYQLMVMWMGPRRPSRCPSRRPCWRSSPEESELGGRRWGSFRGLAGDGDELMRLTLLGLLDFSLFRFCAVDASRTDFTSSSPQSSTSFFWRAALRLQASHAPFCCC